MTVRTRRVNSTEKPDLRPYVVSVPEFFGHLPVGACFSSMDPNLMRIDYVKVSANRYRRVDFFVTFEADDPLTGLQTWRYAEEVPRPDDYIEGIQLDRVRAAEAEHARAAWEDEANQRLCR